MAKHKPGKLQSVESSGSAHANDTALVTEDTSEFIRRHIGPSESDVRYMLDYLQETSLDKFIQRVVPESILDVSRMELPPALDEAAALRLLATYAKNNTVGRSLIGQGYHGCHTPSVISRNVFENPGWYTAYTPYQPEIAQGRLEVLFNFQTMVTELTGLDIANASLLDEATAVSEAMAMAHRALRGKRNRLIAMNDCHPQTLDVLKTRAAPLGIEIELVDPTGFTSIDNADSCFAVLLQYPGSDGTIHDVQQISRLTKDAGALLLVAADILSLTLLTPPAEFNADIVVGSAQRFGVPMGFGGPHAAFMATTDKLKRGLPGRLVGESLDSHGVAAYRLALQTREQHIRREKATSNICTAQALLAIMSTLYACYHGAAGLKTIALRTHAMALSFRDLMLAAKIDCKSGAFFDTVRVDNIDAAQWLSAADKAGFNLRKISDASVSASFDETTTVEDVVLLCSALLQGDSDVAIQCRKS